MKKKFKFAPLNASYLLFSLLGLIVSIFYLAYPTFNLGSIFLTFFIIMFFVSLFQKGPTSLAYMITFILGIIASILLTWSQMREETLLLNLSNQAWGFTFSVFFGIMFITSMISMSTAEPDEFIEIEKKKL